MDVTWTESRFLKCPLMPDELRARGEQLAKTVKDAEEVRAEQKAERERMKEELEAVEGQIAHLAKIVREGVEERSVKVEVHYSHVRVEAVRLDTGESIEERPSREEDRLRAEVHAQMTISDTSSK